MSPRERDADLLRLILELIGHLRRQTSAIDRETFLSEPDHIDLASFRLAHIGEASKKLSEGTKSAHPNIRWRSMIDMRNVLSHDYPAIKSDRLWSVIRDELDLLEAACRAELERLGG